MWHVVDENVTTSSGQGIGLGVMLVMIMINVAELVSERVLCWEL
jgi:hypothetical protein